MRGTNLPLFTDFWSWINYSGQWESFLRGFFRLARGQYCSAALADILQAVPV